MFLTDINGDLLNANYIVSIEYIREGDNDVIVAYLFYGEGSHSPAYRPLHICREGEKPQGVLNSMRLSLLELSKRR